MINGRDISQHTHDQVVNFIRASSEPHSAQLELAVRQVNKTKICFQEFFHFTKKIYFIINFEISRMRTWVKLWKSPNSNMYLTLHTLVLWSQEPKLYRCLCIYQVSLKKIGLFQDTYWLLFGLYQVFYISLITPLSIIFSFTNFRRIIGFRSYLWPI